MTTQRPVRTSDTLPRRRPHAAARRVLAGGAGPILRLGVVCGALLGLGACGSAHIVIPLDDDDAGVVLPDTGPVIEPCPVTYELREVTVPPIAEGSGFDLDGGGSEAGCREDGPGGVDNGIQELDSFVSGLFSGFSLNVFITRASREGFLEIPAIRIDRCSAQPTIQAVTADGSVIGAAVPLEVAPDGGFFAQLSGLSFSIRYLPTLYSTAPYEHALVVGEAVGTTTVQLRWTRRGFIA